MSRPCSSNVLVVTAPSGLTICVTWPAAFRKYFVTAPRLSITLVMGGTLLYCNFFFQVSIVPGSVNGGRVDRI